MAEFFCKRSIIGFLFIAVLFSTGCKSPFSRTSDSSSGPTGSLGGSGQFPIFSNELVTGGGAFEYPGGDNLSLSFTDISNPISKRSIRFSWNGQPTLSGGVSTFAGFSLMDVPVFANYATTPGRNLSAAGYTKAVFYARGSLSTYNSVKIEAGGPVSACITLSLDGSVDDCSSSGEGNMTGVLSSAWQMYTLPLTSGEQSAIKDFLKATFVFDTSQLPPGDTTPGQGGTLYLDQIFYKAS